MRVVLHCLLLVYLLNGVVLESQAQTITEKLIVQDAGDSLKLKAFRTTFDSNGNYYFETLLKGKGDKFALVTGKKNYNLVYWGQGIALQKYKALIADAFYADSGKKTLYYKNKRGTSVYGPRTGKIRDVLEFGRNDIAIELCVGAKSSLYINDSLVNTTDSLKQRWLCHFSENGHVIYTVFRQGLYRLYVNHIQVDSAAEPFSEIAINNNKFYTYVKSINGKYFIHTTNKSFGPFKIVDYADLWNNDAYYYRGCADSMCYVLVNNKLYDNIAEAHTNIEDP
ncbi:MAG: hypothetical protein EBX41_06530, partial [Chitinophagia bacterium]|nr:hypothetical protein [Chitinophagia bacterium]